MWWGIGIGLFLYVILLLTLGFMTIKNGHAWMFFFGIFPVSLAHRSPYATDEVGVRLSLGSGPELPHRLRQAAQGVLHKA